MNNYFLGIACLFVSIGFCYGCEPGEKITWSGVECECAADGTVYNCPAPLQEVEYSTCGNKVIQWACTTCTCKVNRQNNDYVSCGEPTCNKVALGQPGHCICWSFKCV